MKLTKLWALLLACLLLGALVGCDDPSQRLEPKALSKFIDPEPRWLMNSFLPVPRSHMFEINGGFETR